jgi:hypothetical protein
MEAPALRESGLGGALPSPGGELRQRQRRFERPFRQPDARRRRPPGGRAPVAGRWRRRSGTP